MNFVPDVLFSLFVNAGVAKFVPTEQVEEAHFDETFNINVKGAFFTIQKLLPVLRDGSSIVLNGSNIVHAGFPAAVVYAASKAALNSFAKSLSKDLLPRHIRVNVVNPGPTDTPIVHKFGWSPEQAEAATKALAQKVPIGRAAHPDEIAHYVLFLLSDKSSFILGTELTVDGGLTQL
jgi:NAD(P)-dependent dehydrogenase (short-subunit alcohol dehydrogenase family)